MSTRSSIAPSAVSVQMWSGRFSDGQTARAEQRDVRLANECIVLLDDRGRTQEVVPFDNLSVGTGLTPKSKDVLLTFADPAGASLFVEDASFVAELARRAPQFKRSSQRSKAIRPVAIGATAVAAVIGLGWWLDVRPVQGLARMLPDSVRQSLGDNVVRSLTKKRPACVNSNGQRALQSLVARLSAASGSKKTFKVQVVKWRLVNAFATPGERVVLTSGLIRQARSPEEVAGVLAHEMGHGIELHPESGFIRAIGLSALAEAMFGGGTIANIGLVLTRLKYSRDGERDADRHALRILKQAEIGAQGFADFFRRQWKRRQSRVGRQFSVFSTHPGARERARLAERQTAYPTRPALSARDWSALRRICLGAR